MERRQFSGRSQGRMSTPRMWRLLTVNSFSCGYITSVVAFSAAFEWTLPQRRYNRHASDMSSVISMSSALRDAPHHIAS
jgi:hypothetical protein